MLDRTRAVISVSRLKQCSCIVSRVSVSALLAAVSPHTQPEMHVRLVRHANVHTLRPAV